MDDLKRIVDEHTVDIQKLKEGHKVHGVRLDEHHEAIAGLQDSEKAIMERLGAMSGAMATKDDIIGVKSHVSDAVQGILRDALNAVPAQHAVQAARQGNVWLAIAAVAGMFGALVSLAIFIAEKLK